MMWNLLRGSALLRYLLLVGTPLLVCAVYLAFIASEGYVSRSTLMIEKESSSISAPDLALGMLGIGSGSTKVDALVVKAYMESTAMFESLDEEFQLVAHFSSREIDPFQRLDDAASRNDMHDHFLRHIDVRVDEESFIIDVELVAYDSAYAEAVLQGMVERGEAFVNEVSHYLAREQMKFIEQEVERAQNRLAEATKKVIALQKKYEVFSPEMESEAAAEIVGGLMEELVRQRTLLKAQRSYLNPGASELRVTEQRVKALEEQLQQERDRLVGSGTLGLNELFSEYQDAEVGVRVAEEVYKASIASLESTRLDTARKVKYLVSISPPSLPDEAERPRFAYWFFTLFVFLNLSYFVIGLVIAAIKDHRE